TFHLKRGSLASVLRSRDHSSGAPCGFSENPGLRPTRGQGGAPNQGGGLSQGGVPSQGGGKLRPYYGPMHPTEAGERFPEKHLWVPGGGADGSHPVLTPSCTPRA